MLDPYIDVLLLAVVIEGITRYHCMEAAGYCLTICSIAYLAFLVLASIQI